VHASSQCHCHAKTQFVGTFCQFLKSADKTTLPTSALSAFCLAPSFPRVDMLYGWPHTLQQLTTGLQQQRQTYTHRRNCLETQPRES